MIKRTLYFGNPAYLSLNNAQLVVRLPEIEKDEYLSTEFKKTATATIPVEDVGVVVLDHKHITITQGLIAALVDNNAAIITCNDTRHPTGLLMPLDKNEIQSQRFKAQIEASAPLKKNLWQQTIQTKIINQAMVLKRQGVPHDNMLHWANSVKSGDGDNHEARAAAYYWGTVFGNKFGFFLRDREGPPPNNLLNYGYAILRAIVARGLVGSGLLPTLGIHHRNKYNAYCLADDIMEPYRPYVDEVVLDIIKQGPIPDELTKELKAELLKIPTLDIEIEGYKSPLMVGLQRTTASLAKCYEGELRKIVYPKMA
jgi:CRISPR-associated protein Cas1